MKRFPCTSLIALGLALGLAVSASAQTNPKFEPTVGQPGKDVVWVPTPEVLVEKMLDMARVTPQDLVMDLGSGDGRNIIGAAKRGARAIGVEYNPDMVALSNRRAKEAGVADKASFMQGDMFEADISKATVLALFLLPDNLTKLRDKFLAMRPGTRIVMNTFAIPEWTPDEEQRVENDCTSWCTSLLYIVPAKVAGTWRMPQGTLTLRQTYQILSGELVAGGKTLAISNGKLRGDLIAFTVDGVEYSGRVTGDAMSGTSKAGAWKAIKGS